MSDHDDVTCYVIVIKKVIIMNKYNMSSRALKDAPP